MKKRSEKDPQEKRARLDALLFNGVNVATTLVAVTAFQGSKIPPWQGE